MGGVDAVEGAAAAKGSEWLSHRETPSHSWQLWGTGAVCQGGGERGKGSSCSSFRRLPCPLIFLAFTHYQKLL